VIRAEHRFGTPFLLEKGFGFVGWSDDAREIVKIVFAPGLAYFGFAQGLGRSISHGV
jgi:hypothetical protein